MTISSKPKPKPNPSQAHLLGHQLEVGEGDGLVGLAPLLEDGAQRGALLVVLRRVVAAPQRHHAREQLVEVDALDARLVRVRLSVRASVRVRRVRVRVRVRIRVRLTLTLTRSMLASRLACLAVTGGAVPSGLASSACHSAR